MNISKEKIRYILQFYFDKGDNAIQAAEHVNSVYGPDTVTANQAQIWFSRFQSGNFNVKDAPSTGRPIVKNVDKIIEIVESDRHVSTVSIAQELNIAQKTVWNHLRKTGYTKKLDVWVPHELTEKNLMDRISICESLMNRNKIDPFLRRMVIGDEKWITYSNVKRKRPQKTVYKPELTARKALFCVWWDWQGIINYELLPDGQTLNPDLHCQQLERLKEAIVDKRPDLANSRGILLHQDNHKPHTTIATHQKLRELGWEVLIHPHFSPDLAPSDYHLFPSMANYLDGEELASRESCENRLSQFFSNRDKSFYAEGIMTLPSKWQKVMEHNGAYLTEIE
ncbi:uncharacterized protein LOC101457564 isoform X1 [Ceratitis capitata]|nr:uncharacterized protein LOC101457564 isoform X1 [Ceratitis capitata]XP_020715243.1 uncharacterized protein LOC101457564 isoform X1 [Ceratitis capitata]